MKSFIFFIFLSSTSVAEEINCTKEYLDLKKVIQTIRNKYADSADVDIYFEAYEKGAEQIKLCPQYVNNKSIKLPDYEIAKYRKSIHAPDRSANLDEAQCTELSISTAHMPKNSHQSQLNWCFAWTAADLISFHEQKAISAYDLALQYHHEEEVPKMHTKIQKKPVSQRGGNVSTAFRIALNSKGMCLEEETDYLNGKWELNGLIFKKLIESPSPFMENLCQMNLANVQPFSSFDKDILKILDKLSSDKKMAAFLDLTCRQRHEIKNQYRILTIDLDRPGATREKMLNKLDMLLNNGEPASISYDSNTLYNGHNYKGKEADHSSTIIGRKFNTGTGQCEYLIKNSWGNDTDCQHTNSIRCEKGNYWVPRTALKNSLFVVDWIEKKK